MRASIIFLSILLLLLQHSHLVESARKRKPKLLIVHKKTAIRNLALAKASLPFPNLIPLLYGNSIQGYTSSGKAFTIIHSATRKTEILPLKHKHAAKNVAGFVIKSSSPNTYPLSLEKSLLILKLRPISSVFGELRLWFISPSSHRRRQKFRRFILTKSLVQDFADNAQRVLGVNGCSEFISISGLCNNRLNPLFGVTITDLRMDFPHSRFPTTKLNSWTPGTRLVSNTIFKVKTQRFAPRNINMLMIIFGQLIDHEIILTHENSNAPAPIPIPDSASHMEFSRTAILPYHYSQCCTAKYIHPNIWERTAFNDLTAFIDGGIVYGSDNFRANALRSFRGGKLILKRSGSELLLPRNHLSDLAFTVHNLPKADDPSLFVSGDVRANENPFLLAMHTLFAREHNRVCDVIARWMRRRASRKIATDSWIYNQARQIVIAELQSILFNEFVPAMLGYDALGDYDGYNSSVDATISTFHSSFAYRWGHSAIVNSINIKNKQGKIEKRFVKDLLFKPNELHRHGIDNLILACMDTAAKDVDEQVEDVLRDFLFHANERGVLDLVALNIQRGRDFGIPSYTEIQRLFDSGEGLENIKPELREPLLKLYGHADKIDAFVGSLAEKRKSGSIFGPLLQAINVDQFKRLRDGDRFYYENMKWHPEIKELPLVEEIMLHEIGMHNIVYENTNIPDSAIADRDSFFKTGH